MPWRWALVVAGVGLAVVAEWRSYGPGDLQLVIGDGVVGVVLVCCGVIAWQRRATSRTGPLMVVAGIGWFAGNFGRAALFWHRGPLIHLHLSYPTGRLRRRLPQVTVALAYLDAVVQPFASSDVVTLVLAGLVGVAAVDVFERTSGPMRKANRPALAAALAFAAVLALGSAQRLAGWDADRSVLLLYDAVIATVAVGLLLDLLYGRWTDATVADLVVGLGETGGVGTLRHQLARALGDPSLEVGYWVEEQRGYVDEAGHALEPPAPGDGRALTEITERGQPLAVLVHDSVAVEDPRLVDAVATAARLAVSNARLQAAARARVAELAASRRRIVEASDAQRRLLERELVDGPERRLAIAARLLDDAERHAAGNAAVGLRDVGAELSAARGELRDFAQGVHPSALGHGGLAAALPVLADRAPVPVELTVDVGRLEPVIEAAVYFLCSEALTNVAKHAAATQVSVTVTRTDGRVVARIADDGGGGADPARGSGLRGLADRVEAIDGRLEVDSTERGTCVTVTIPEAGSSPA